MPPLVVADDGVFVNAKMLHAGLTRVSARLPLRRLGELRRRSPARLADDRAVAANDLVVDRQAQLELGHVGQQVLAAHVAGEPAPAVHVGADQRPVAGS